MEILLCRTPDYTGLHSPLSDATLKSGRLKMIILSIPRKKSSNSAANFEMKRTSRASTTDAGSSCPIQKMSNFGMHPDCWLSDGSNRQGYHLELNLHYGI